MTELTLEELREHCLKTISNMHKFALVNHKKHIDVTDNKIFQEHKMVLDLIEKQLPKKPYTQQIEIDDYDRDCLECPNCDSFIGFKSECKNEYYQLNYCSCCGQALDWNIDFE